MALMLSRTTQRTKPHVGVGPMSCRERRIPRKAATKGRTMRRREFIALLSGAVVTRPLDVLASVGRRSAIERTAHFFMQLAERLNLVGLATEVEFKCPLTQFIVADALGLTAIHINRVLRQLRERDLLTLQKGAVKIHDLNGLRKLAGFHGAT